jgi:small subunit ribosomal protein S17
MTAIASQVETSTDRLPPCRGHRKTAVGVVTSDRCAKTITVECTRLVKHPLYGKYLRRTTKCAAHDEKGEARVGDRVEIMECRPLSKRKRWRLLRVIERARHPLAEAAAGGAAEKAAGAAPAGGGAP